jgi:hypothetical protein
MRRHRYQRHKTRSPEQDQLPLDTLCTILIRQSTSIQRERNLFSAEVNPDDLVASALRFGFARERIEVVETDMGIGAYSTRIEDRPGLHKWLYEDLPSGRSRVLMASQEDRLFRDRDEIDHNRFIAQVAACDGWVICGQTIYNLRRDFDRERFRMACKSNKFFIEYHIKGRLHPAVQRAALQGRYTGGQVPMGYVVDYDSRSETYKHYIVYLPHTSLIVDHIFRYFAALPRPSAMAVARHWEEQGLFWPFYGPEVDPRVIRAGEAGRKRDEALGGYRLGWAQAQHILTDVVYLGWRVRAGEVAWDTAHNAPRVCHPPLVDPELFWWCYDRLVAERPPWAPPPVDVSVPIPRPRRSRSEMSGKVRFLAHGRVRCAVHGTTLAVRDSHGHVGLQCNGRDFRVYRSSAGCAELYGEPVEAALLAGFIEQLTLDERDIAAMAFLLDQREGSREGQHVRLRREIAERGKMYTRAMELALRDENAAIAEDLLGQAKQAKQIISQLEKELAELLDEQPISSRAWLAAQHAAGLAARIRATFHEWARTYQSQLISLALDDAVLGYVDRRLVGLWMRWRGGGETRKEMVPVLGQHLRWSEEEKEAIRRYYPCLTWNALQRMLPARSSYAIKHIAKELGVVRPNAVILQDTVPCVVHPDVTNTMAAYGFPLDGARGAVEKTWADTEEVTRGQKVQRDQMGMNTGLATSAGIQMGSEQLALSVAPSARARR